MKGSPRFLPARAVALLPVSGNAWKLKRGDGAYGDPWVWVYLTACCALAFGFKEARAIVLEVRRGRP